MNHLNLVIWEPMSETDGGRENDTWSKGHLHRHEVLNPSHCLLDSLQTQSRASWERKGSWEVQPLGWRSWVLQESNRSKPASKESSPLASASAPVSRPLLRLP